MEFEKPSKSPVDRSGRQEFYKEKVNVVWDGGTMVPRSVDTGIFTYKAGEVASGRELDDSRFGAQREILGTGDDPDPIAYIYEVTTESKPNRGPSMPTMAAQLDGSVHHVCGITPYYMIAEGDPDPVSETNFDNYRAEVRDWVDLALENSELVGSGSGRPGTAPLIGLIDTGYISNEGKEATLVELPQDEEFDIDDDEVRSKDKLVPKVQGEAPEGKEGDPLGLLNRAAGHGAFVISTVGHVWKDARILLMRAKSDVDGVVDEATVCEQIIAAANAGVNVINLSLGCYAARDDTPVIFRETLEHVLGENKDLVVVAAAGNDGSNRKFFPAALSQQSEPLKRLVSVGALDGAQKASYSNRGLWVDWYTPGTNVIGRYVGGRRNVVFRTNVGDGLQVPYVGFAQWSGTSYSAPYLSALIARVMSENDLSAAEAWQRLANLSPTLRRRLRLLASDEV